MLQAVSRPELDPREIENAIKGEASLCYRLLRHMNSARFGFAKEIHSVQHALSMLGEREVRRWVRLVATLAAGQNKSSEIVPPWCVPTSANCSLPKSSTERPTCFYWVYSLLDSILQIPDVRGAGESAD
jgi:hypothetical protein